MSEEEEKKPNSMIYIFPDIVEEIFLRLPLKSVRKFSTVSKQWRSTLESEVFTERRMNFKKSRKILLAAYNCNCGCYRPGLLPESSRFEGDEEIVYIHCDGTRPSLACNGLVCFPEPDCIIVMNPSTQQLLRFPSGPDPVSPQFRSNHFLGNRVMGFGRDRVTGSYKVAKMFVERMFDDCDVLDVESGEWKKLRRPPYVTDLGRQSVCVNGSIYWLYSDAPRYHLLALNLHKEEFHKVSVPETLVKRDTLIVNLEDSLAISNTRADGILEIYIEKEVWSKTYSITLPETMCCMPVSVSKQGNLVFSNSEKRRLFKYYPETGEIRCLSLDLCVISPYLENLAPLRSQAGHYTDHKIRIFRCRLVLTPLRRVKFGILVLNALVVFIVGYFLMGPFTLEGLRTTHEWWTRKNQVYTSKVTGGSLSLLVLVSLCYCYIFSIRELVRFFLVLFCVLLLLVFLVCKRRSPLLHFFLFYNLWELR